MDEGKFSMDSVVLLLSFFFLNLNCFCFFSFQSQTLSNKEGCSGLFSLQRVVKKQKIPSVDHFPTQLFERRKWVNIHVHNVVWTDNLQLSNSLLSPSGLATSTRCRVLDWGGAWIQDTQEIKRTLFIWTKQDKTCKFLRKSFFFFLRRNMMFDHFPGIPTVDENLAQLLNCNELAFSYHVL